MNGVQYLCSGIWGVKLIDERSAKRAKAAYARYWLGMVGDVCNREAVRRTSRGVRARAY